MTHRPPGDDLETRLGAAFRSRDLPAAPGRLLDALERVPDEALATDRESRRADRPGRKTAFWLVGLAAAVALGGAVILGGGGRSDPRPAPSDVPPSRPATVLMYEIAWGAGTPFSDASLARMVEVVRGRLDATGIVGATVDTADQAHLVVTIPPDIDPAPFRGLVGQRGVVAFVPLGGEAASEGDRIDLARFPPLFGGDGIADAKIAAGQQGKRVIEIDLAPAAASLFEDYTTAHIGNYFAIVLDELAVSVPVINSAIPGGRVQISQGGTVGGWPLEEAQQLVAVLRGPLPAPIREISRDGLPIEPSAAPASASPAG